MYLDASAEIGRQLGLFDRQYEETVAIYFEDQDMASVASYVAWGTFAWQT